MAQHLLVAADRFQLPRLRRICERRLCETVEVPFINAHSKESASNSLFSQKSVSRPSDGDIKFWPSVCSMSRSYDAINLHLQV